MAKKQAFFHQLAAVTEEFRHRILHLLDGRELTVTELCDILQAPQSTISRHLKMLLETDWIGVRKEGTSRLYRRVHTDENTEQLWGLIRSQQNGDGIFEQDQHRLQAVLRLRGDRSRAFFNESSKRWDSLRDELYGANFSSHALMGLLDESWTVADLGCGTGRFTYTLAERCKKVLAIDENQEMLSTAKRRLTNFSNVQWKTGSLEAIPIAEHSVDVAFLMLVLHHLPDPTQVLKEVARILKSAGRLILVDMQAHNREDYRLEMGHVWLGFDPKSLKQVMRQAGLNPLHLDPLPAESGTKGPALFSAVAKKAA